MLRYSYQEDELLIDPKIMVKHHIPLLKLFIIFCVSLGMVVIFLIPNFLKTSAKSNDQFVFLKSPVRGEPAQVITATPTTDNSKQQKQKTPRPTPTPLLIPPPSDPNTTNLMICFSIIMISAILFGLWINRRKLSIKGENHDPRFTPPTENIE